MMTQAQIEAVHEVMIEAIRAGDDEAATDALTALGDLVDQAAPANSAFAESLVGDYICTLEDGTIAAWGADFPVRGRICRELLFIAPAEQK